MFHFLTMNNFTRRKNRLYYYYIIILHYYMYRTKEKERERAKWASLDLRAMRVGDRCHARSFLFFFLILLYLQGGKLMTRYSFNA